MHAHDPFLVGQRELVAGFEAVDLPHRDVAGIAQRFVAVGIGRLAVIEIAVPFGNHDDRISLPCGFDARFLAVP